VACGYLARAAGVMPKAHAVLERQSKKADRHHVHPFAGMTRIRF
jgi:hypothetical protein